MPSIALRARFAPKKHRSSRYRNLCTRQASRFLAVVRYHPFASAWIHNSILISSLGLGRVPFFLVFRFMEHKKWKEQTSGETIQSHLQSHVLRASNVERSRHRELKFYHPSLSGKIWYATSRGGGSIQSS